MKFLRDARVVAALILCCMLIWNKAHAGTVTANFTTYEEARDACLASRASKFSLGWYIDPALPYSCSYFGPPYKVFNIYYKSVTTSGGPVIDQFWRFFHADTGPCTLVAGGSADVEADWTCPTPGPTEAECEARPTTYSSFQMANGSLVCLDGCEMANVNLGDGGETSSGPTGETCDGTLTEWDCPAGYTDSDTIVNNTYTGFLGVECIPDEGDQDGDGIPNDEDPTPFDSGQEPVDNDGDGVPDNRDFAPGDETNGEDTGAGDETDNVSSGGGNCSTPPVSTGDGIAAQTAYQTWATRCAVERMHSTLKDAPEVTLTGGTSGGGDAAGSTTTGGTNCATPYVCSTGDTVACQALKEAHKDRCNSDAAEARVADVTANGATGGNGNDEGDLADAVVDGEDLGSTVLDDTGWLGTGRSCPAEAGVLAELAGFQYSEWVCDPMSMLAAFMLFAMYVHGGIILARAASGT